MRASDPLPLEFDLPTTAEDVAALRAARQRTLVPAARTDAWRSWQSLPPAKRSRTHAGFEPFELEPESR